MPEPTEREWQGDRVLCWHRVMHGRTMPYANEAFAITDEMVERGAREIDPCAFSGKGYSPEAAAQSREDALGMARVVLTAALHWSGPSEHTNEGETE